jgi:hypothetical protein
MQRHRGIFRELRFPSPNSTHISVLVKWTRNGIPFQSSAMRSFVLGIAVGAIVAIAVGKLAPARYTPVAGGRSLPASVGSTASEPICGRDTFNILVDVQRILVPGHDKQFLSAFLKKQEALADGIQARLDRAGLRRDPACPVILNLFGMLQENERGGWSVAALVRTELTSESTMAYPVWDSTMYKVSHRHLVEAQADLETVLTERVQRFLKYFGKQ